MKSADTIPRLGKGLLIVVLVILLFLTAGLSQAAEQKVRDLQTAREGHASAIPVADVASRATEASNALRSLRARFAPGREIEKIQKDLDDVSHRTAMELWRLMKLLRGQPTLEMLQTEQRLWEKNQDRIAGWMHLLTQRAAAFEAALSQILDIQKEWNQTLEAAQAAQAPETVLNRIKAVLTAAEAARTSLQARRSGAIGLQDSVAEELAQCEIALAHISQAQKMAVVGIARRERLPIWSSELWARGRTEGFAGVREIAVERWTDIERYLTEADRGMPIHLVLFVVLSVLFFAMRRQLHQWTTGKDSAVVTSVLEHPFLSAFISTLILASSPYWPFSPAPPTVRNLLELLALAAMIRLMRQAFDHRAVFGLYALWLLFALDTVRHAFADAALFDQSMVVLEALLGIAVLTWSLSYGSLQQSFTQATGFTHLRTLRLVASLVLAILGAGLLAGALGYMREARLLVSGVLFGGAQALTLAVSIKILCSMAAFCLSVWPFRLMQMVRRHRDLLERRIYRILVWLAIAGWLTRLLDYVGLLQPVLLFGRNMLSAKLERGSISVSLGDVVAFALSIWAAFLLSSFIRFVLQEEVYPRKNVPYGTGYAASRLVHYAILTLGLVVGLGMLGVDLNKVVVLFSAVGVGIGFGLKDVVNNFISGLILLFERPIHLGDTIDVGDLEGQVQRIGIRSSVVRTRRGAEISVPNALLVSESLTNWTLSDQHRRIDLQVGVNYAADPQKVIEVIVKAAAKQPDVLAVPPPRAFLVGFGDSSINFELRAWTDQVIDWIRVKSELAVAVYQAVNDAADISFPFPQREVRLLHDEEG